MFYRTAVALFALFYLWLALDLARNKSATWDEPAHLAAGYSYWVNGDHRLLTSNGVLSQKISTLPLLWMRPAFPSPEEQEALHRDSIQIGRRFLYFMGNDAKAILFASRIPNVLVGLALGFGVLVWARALFGPNGGLLAFVLYATCPAIIANSALVTTDIDTAAVFFLATWASWRLSERCTWQGAAFFGFSLGLLMVTKFSFAILLGVAGILFATRLIRIKPLRIGWPESVPDSPGTPLPRLFSFAFAGLEALLVSVFVIWAIYGFHHTESGYALDWDGLGMGTITQRVASVLRPVLPEPYVMDLAGFRKLVTGRGAFLHGEYSTSGFWLFFPCAFLIKTPVPLLVTLLLAATILLTNYSDNTLKRKALPLAVLGVAYLACAVFSKVNIGHRHILPIYPAFCVLSGAAANLLVRNRRIGLCTLGIVAPWCTIEALQLHPLELSYFNQFVGGTENGWRWLVDSSCDWGGELPAFRDWLQKNTRDGSPRTYFIYFGTAPPGYYDIKAKPIEYFFSSNEIYAQVLHGGLYCISASALQYGSFQAPGPWREEYENRYQVLRADFPREPTQPEGIGNIAAGRDHFNGLLISRLCSLLRQRRPQAIVAASILIYRLDEKDIQTVIAGTRRDLLMIQPARNGQAGGHPGN